MGNRNWIVDGLLLAISNGATWKLLDSIGIATAMCSPRLIAHGHASS
jgi:hypothetical protein